MLICFLPENGPCLWPQGHLGVPPSVFPAHLSSALGVVGKDNDIWGGRQARWENSWGLGQIINVGPLHITDISTIIACRLHLVNFVGVWDLKACPEN